jgi:hypothetical protein
MAVFLNTFPQRWSVLDELRDYRVFKEDPASWSWIFNLRLQTLGLFPGMATQFSNRQLNVALLSNSRHPEFSHAVIFTHYI